MNLAQAVVEAYKRKWSYINNFSVTIGFANEDTAKGIGWTEKDAKGINLNIKNIDVPQLTCTPIETFIGDQWRFHNGRDELYSIRMTIRDEQMLRYYRMFSTLYHLTKKRYFDDVKLTITVFKDPDYQGEKQVKLAEYEGCICTGVSQLQFSNETESQIVEFDVDFKCQTPNVKFKRS